MCVPKKEGGLGFKDIEMFNDALLTKQAWRILQNPDCLLAKTLRGRYFYSTNVLNATRGTQPFFAWKSILEERDLLKKGLRFIIGDGSMIQTWIDPWLNTQPPRPPRMKDNIQLSHTRVQELFTPFQKAGDVEKVHELVHPQDVQHVLSLKFSPTQNSDYLGWNGTESGIYMVKSGYWLRAFLTEIYKTNLFLRIDY